MTFAELSLDFLIALLIGGGVGAIILVLRAPLPASRRLRALRRRLLGRAWRPVLLIPVEVNTQDVPAPAEVKPSASSQ